MKKQNQKIDDRKSDICPTQRRKSYEPPKAVFVPLQLQERLFGSTAYSEHGGSC
jgi:hypothetical protein